MHQLDLVMQSVFKSSLEGKLYSNLNNLIVHLRRQANFISEMRSMFPKVCDVLWISMFSLTNWSVENRSRFQQHSGQKKPGCAPSKIWCIFLHVMNDFSAESKLVFIYMQGLAKTVSRQQSRLTSFGRHLLPDVWNGRAAVAAAD